MPKSIIKLAQRISAGIVSSAEVKETMRLYTYESEWKDSYHQDLPDAIDEFEHACSLVAFDPHTRQMVIDRARKATIKAVDLTDLLGYRKPTS